MHMSDALLSPVVGGIFWTVSAVTIGISAKKITSENDIAKTPLMGVMGAFIFAAQMINFAIPGTGSSGHIGGGLLLTILLGPWRAFLTLASVLVVQCLFFADGGLLALGCNIFNLAFFPAFIAYPFIYRPIMKKGFSGGKLLLATIAAAVTSLQFGAFSVVIQTVLSGNSDLPFTTFVLFMQPIHFVIGIVEGVITWGVLVFVRRIQPSLLSDEPTHAVAKPLAVILTIIALATGGILSYAASSDPDGLEWSVAKATHGGEVSSDNPFVTALKRLQDKTAFLPDYAFKESTGKEKPHPMSALGNSVAGISGTIIVLLTALGLGIVIRKRSRQTKPL